MEIMRPELIVIPKQLEISNIRRMVKRPEDMVAGEDLDEAAGATGEEGLDRVADRAEGSIPGRKGKMKIAFVPPVGIP